MTGDGGSETEGKRESNEKGPNEDGERGAHNRVTGGTERELEHPLNEG